MTKTLWLASTAIVAAAMVVAPAYAGGKTKQDTRDQEIQELKARLDRLEREQEDDKIAAQRQNQRVNELTDRANETQWSFDNGRPTVKSGDGRFTMAFRGRFHADFVNYFQDNADIGAGLGLSDPLRDLGSGAVIRRAQFGVEGKVFKDFDYEMRFNFGGSDAEGTSPTINILRVAYTGIPNFRINAGIIQPIFTQDDSTSSNEITFMERASVINAFLGAFGGSDERRGVELTYQKSDFLLGGDNIVLTSAFTGQTTNSPHSGGASLDDEETHIVGRLAYRVYSDADTNIQIGADAGKILNFQGTTPGTAHTVNFQDRPEYRVDGTRLISTGNIPATGAELWGLEAGAQFMNFYLSGEYYDWTADRDPAIAAGDPEFSGWYVQASWILTGEKKPYAASGGSNSMGVWGAPKVALPFSFDGKTWGAWELAGRYSTVNLNWNEGVFGAPTPAGGIRGGEQKIWTVGVNWYLNNNIRLMFDYSMVDVDRLNAAGADVGQELDIFGMRTQFAF